MIIANIVRECTELNQVWFVVSPQNPFKTTKSLLPDIDRLRMVELAIEDNFDLRACNVEFSMPKPSYTVDTLAYLSEKYPQHEFYLIMGNDNLLHFHKWKNYKQILKYAGIFTYPRPNADASKIEEEIKNHPKIEMVEAPLLDISATFIRNCVKNEISIKYLVHEKVEEYIYARKLFY